MEKTAKVIIIILLLYIISLCSFSGCNGKTKVIEIEKTDTIQIFDTAYIQQLPETILINKPIPTYITEVRVDTVIEETILITENKIYQDTIVSCQNDSILQEISITGINPTLDYNKVTLKKQDRVITNTIEITKLVKDNKKLYFGPSITTGYDFVNKRWGAMAGVSLIYRF